MQQFNQITWTFSFAAWVMKSENLDFQNKPYHEKGNISALYGSLVFSVNSWTGENFPSVIFSSKKLFDSFLFFLY